MPNVIKPKRSYTATNTPTLASGEIGINAADGKIYLGNAAGSANILVSSLARTDHTGTLTVANGGTGLTTLTANNVILGNGTSTPSFVAPGASGNLLTSNGTTWASATPVAATGTPTGVLMPYAGTTAPSGYLLCNGSSVSSSTYLALHAVISNTYGGSAYTGAGSLNFNLPDLRGRMAMGAGTGVGLNASGTGVTSGTAMTARALGAWLGEETHLLTTAEMPSHNHTANTGSAGSHFHSFGRPAISFNSPSGNFSVSTPGGTLHRFSDSDGVNDTNTAPNHQHTITAEGGGSRHSVVPPVVVLNYIIKT